MAYTGTSIVDYLNSVGQASDYNSRAKLAAKSGISNYTGTAAQNTQLLGMLNKPAPAPTVAPKVTTPAPVTTLPLPTTRPPATTTPAPTTAPKTTTTPAPSTTANQGYSTIPGDYDPVTGKLKATATPTTPAPTATPTATATAPDTSAYTKAYQDYIDSLTAKSSETSAAKKKYLDFIAEKDKSLADIGNQRIPLGFVTGQQAYVSKVAQTEANRLQGDVGLAQEAEQFAGTTGQAKFDYAKTLLDSKNAESAPVKLGDSLYQKQSDGSYKMIAGDEAKTSLPASAQEYEYAKSQGFTGSFNDYQNADANRKAKATGNGTGGLTLAQINSTVNSIAGAFYNEPIVKNYNTVQEGYQTIKSIGVNTKSPADDIAFIYAFAKIQDPNSVVREGEYNTIQKYAQTWADNFGFFAARIFSNTNFLTADAKQKMLNTLKPKVDTITNQYKQTRAEYDRQIQDAYAGKSRTITDYTVPESAPPGGGGGSDYTIKAGDTFYKLAQGMGTTVQALQSANPGINPNQLQIGQKIKLPGGGSGGNTDSILSQYGL
jgi:LysM repeat protein